MNDSNKTQSHDEPKFTWTSKNKCGFTPLVESYDVVLMTLLDKKIIPLPNCLRPCDPTVKP